jgi:hypothetical protein
VFPTNVFDVIVFCASIVHFSLHIQSLVNVVSVLFWRVLTVHISCHRLSCNLHDREVPWFFGMTAPQWVRASSFKRFLYHAQRHTTAGSTTLDECSARYRDLYLTTHNTLNRKTSMIPVVFEPTISAGDRPQTYNLHRSATGTGRDDTY